MQAIGVWPGGQVSPFRNRLSSLTHMQLLASVQSFWNFVQHSRPRGIVTLVNPAEPVCPCATFLPKITADFAAAISGSRTSRTISWWHVTITRTETLFLFITSSNHSYYCAVGSCFIRLPTLICNRSKTWPNRSSSISVENNPIFLF